MREEPASSYGVVARVIQYEGESNLEELQLTRDLASLHAVAHTKLAVEMFGVIFDGIDRYHQFPRYLQVAPSGSQQPQDPLLLSGKRFNQ